MLVPPIDASYDTYLIVLVLALTGPVLSRVGQLLVPCHPRHAAGTRQAVLVVVEISLGDVAPQLVVGIQQPLLLGFRETVLGLSQNRAVGVGVLDG